MFSVYNFWLQTYIIYKCPQNIFTTFYNCYYLLLLLGMKKLQITIENEVHAALLKKQLERKLANHNRTTLVEVASDILAECLLKEKAAQK